MRSEGPGAGSGTQKSRRRLQSHPSRVRGDIVAAFLLPTVSVELPAKCAVGVQCSGKGGQVIGSDQIPHIQDIVGDGATTRWLVEEHGCDAAED